MLCQGKSKLNINMRAKEFTINIPIHITLNGDGEPEINMGSGSDDEAVLDQNPVMISPLQQQLELAKAAAGKDSPVIDKITADQPVVGAEDDSQEELKRIQALAAH
jgi:hypothetical protein